jgi:hypothetical protein
VISLSYVPLEEAACSALGKEVNYVVDPAVLLIEVFLSGVKKAVGCLPEEDSGEVQQEVIRILKASMKPKNNLSEGERRAVWALQTSADFTVLSAGKGNMVVVLNTSDYN